MTTKYIVNNATGQTINSNITLSGNSDYILSIRCENDAPWAFGVYNQTYNSGQTIFASWVRDDGQSYIGNEVDTQLNIYANADYDNTGIGITSSGTTIKDDLTVNGDLVVSGNTNIRPYNVYTALLSQNGGSNYITVAEQPLEVGVTYQITFNNDTGDFTNVGAPNNETGTYFVATGTDPNAWGAAELEYNTGAPTTIILENTLGNIWFVYQSNGVYLGRIENGWDVNKLWYGIPGVGDSGVIGIYPGNTKISIEGYDMFIITFNNDYSETINQQLARTPIEIRVYN